MDQPERTYCLGMCYAGPASSVENPKPEAQAHTPNPVLLGKLQPYDAVKQALLMTPAAIIDMIEVAALRGRGGAGFPTAKKWRAVFAQSAKPKYIVVNADEGDPGAFMDRYLLENDPHRVIAGMAIAAFSVGAEEGIIYLRAEYPQASAALESALQEVRAQGLFDFRFDLRVVSGKGSYVCGEETAMLNSIEGQRPEVRTRPPFPTEKGLYAKPTLINNVETFAAIPWILLNGGEAYRQLGFSQSRGTKLVSLNSLFRRPGLYEVEFGISVRDICELGGGLRTGSLKGVLVGGPLAGVVPLELLDTPFGFEELHAIGAGVGHGGIVAFDHQTSVRDLVKHILSFAAYESCGKCTPCRVGIAAMERSLDANQLTPAEWNETVSALSRTSLCGLGTGVGEFAHSLTQYYREELATCFK